MAHHIDDEGRFQSDKYPDLAPDKIVVSFKSPLAWAALSKLADDYYEEDSELSMDIRRRLVTVRENYGD